MARGLITPLGLEPALYASTWPAAVDAGERFGKLAAVGVFHADEEDTFGKRGRRHELGGG